MNEIITLIDEEISGHSDVIEQKKYEGKFHDDPDVNYHYAVIQGLETAKEIVISVCGLKESGAEAGQSAAMPGA